jgi:hypothetical protein
VGPSLLIDAQRRLRAGAKILADLPPAAWVRIEIVCGLGAQATGTYDLTVTLPGRPPQAFRQLACGSAKFNQLEWLGFTSLATDKTAFFLDNVSLKSGR